MLLKNHQKQRFYKITACALGILVNGSSLFAQSFSVSNLGTMPGSDDTSSEAYSLNDYAEIVGTSSKRLRVQGFLWREGNMSPLAAPTGFKSSRALAINNSGLVVGQVTDPLTAGLKPALWQDQSPQVVKTIVDTLKASEASFLGVNSSGQILGRYLNADGTIERGFLFSNNTVKDLGLVYLDGNTVPAGLNNAGSVTGFSYSTDAFGDIKQQSLFSWKESQNIASLTIAAADLSGIDFPQSTDINDAGTVVGYAQYDNGVDVFDTAVSVSKGRLTKLQGLGGESSYAYAINAKDQIVGSADTTNGDAHAVLWQAGKISDLNLSIPANTGWVLQEARDINSCGQIVGIGLLNGQKRGFLLSPTGISACLVRPGITPTPSPTQSPTQSPTSNPSVSPSPSASPAPTSSPSMPSNENSSPSPTEHSTPVPQVTPVPRTPEEPNLQLPGSQPSKDSDPSSPALKASILFSASTQRIKFHAEILNSNSASCQSEIEVAETALNSLDSSVLNFKRIYLSADADGKLDVQAKAKIKLEIGKNTSSKKKAQNKNSLVLRIKSACAGMQPSYSGTLVLLSKSKHSGNRHQKNWLKILRPSSL